MSRNARSVWFMLLLAHTAPARIASSASSHGATCHSERCDGPRSAENVKCARVTKRFGRSRCLIAVLVFDLAGCFASFSLADAIREQRWTYIYIYRYRGSTSDSMRGGDTQSTCTAAANRRRRWSRWCPQLCARTQHPNLHVLT